MERAPLQDADRRSGTADTAWLGVALLRRAVAECTTRFCLALNLRMFIDLVVAADSGNKAGCGRPFAHGDSACGQAFDAALER